MNLVEYILANRGDTSFIGQDKDAIFKLLIFHLNNDTVVTHKNEQDEIDGVLLWHIQKFIPLTVYIVECISTGKKALPEMLSSFVKDMPPNFICHATRNKGAKSIQYKNPHRILKLIEKYVS